MTWIGSANRGERQYERPAKFDIDRGQTRHLAFGHGIHFCLGVCFDVAKAQPEIWVGFTDGCSDGGFAV